MTDIPPSSGNRGYSPPDRYPVEARWGDYVAECLLHRYATSAERDLIASAQTGASSRPLDQALCYTVDSKSYWIWNDATSSWNPMGLGLPTGTVIDYMGTTVPTGYLLCDGATYTVNAVNLQLAKLLTGLASPTSFATPNMLGRVTCMGGGPFSSSGMGSTHGAASVTLTTANMPLHNHTASSGDDSPDHLHTFNTSPMTSGTSLVGLVHNHRANNQDGGWGFLMRLPSYSGSAANLCTVDQVGLGGGVATTWGNTDHTEPGSPTGHSHTLYGQTNGAHVRHKHTITVDNAGSGTAVSLYQPLMLTWKLIRL